MTLTCRWFHAHVTAGHVLRSEVSRHLREEGVSLGVFSSAGARPTCALMHLRFISNPARGAIQRRVRSQDFGNTLAEDFFAKSRS